MKAIVTGATGFIGRELIRSLIDGGIDVVVIVREPKKIPNVWKNTVQVVCSDLSKLDSIADYFKITDADVFYHLGWHGTSGIARTNIKEQLENVDFACKAVRFSAACGCKTFVNAGSIMEYEVIKLMNSGNYIPAIEGVNNFVSLDFSSGRISTHPKHLRIQCLQSFVGSAHTRPPE